MLNKYKSIVDEYGKNFQFSFLAPISLFLMDKLSFMNLVNSRMLGIYHKIGILYGNNNGFINTKLFFAQIFSAEILIFLGFTTFSILQQDLVIFYFGLFLLVLIPFLLIKGLDKQIEKRKNEIIIELPEFLNKVTLLVNAGETIQKAIIKSVENKVVTKSFLYEELDIAVNQMKNNHPFHQVLEQLSKRCGVQEVSIFTTTVLLNYRRGGDEFVIALKNLSKELWEKRKGLAKTLGEQASSKLVFPMILIFIVVMIVIATPAILMF